MSASKMRVSAQDNDLETFEKGLPNFKGVEKLFKDVRKGMNLGFIQQVWVTQTMTNSKSRTV